MSEENRRERREGAATFEHELTPEEQELVSGGFNTKPLDPAIAAILIAVTGPAVIRPFQITDPVTLAIPELETLSMS